MFYFQNSFEQRNSIRHLKLDFNQQEINILQVFAVNSRRYTQ